MPSCMAPLRPGRTINTEYEEIQMTKVKKMQNRAELKKRILEDASSKVEQEDDTSTADSSFSHDSRCRRFARGDNMPETSPAYVSLGNQEGYSKNEHDEWLRQNGVAMLADGETDWHGRTQTKEYKQTSADKFTSTAATLDNKWRCKGDSPHEDSILWKEPARIGSDISVDKVANRAAAHDNRWRCKGDSPPEEPIPCKEPARKRPDMSADKVMNRAATHVSKWPCKNGSPPKEPIPCKEPANKCSDISWGISKLPDAWD